MTDLSFAYCLRVLLSFNAVGCKCQGTLLDSSYGALHFGLLKLTIMTGTHIKPTVKHRHQILLPLSGESSHYHFPGRPIPMEACFDRHRSL